MPLPDARPSAKIAKLFPQTDLAKNAAPAAETAKNPVPVPAAAPPPATAPALPAQAAVVAKPVPLPEARPNIKPGRETRRYRRTGRAWWHW
jgi:membrane-bound lytic murein transglycosylase A